MIAIMPSDRERRRGRAACVAGWQQFVDAVKIKETKMDGGRQWRISSPHIQFEYIGGG